MTSQLKKRMQQLDEERRKEIMRIGDLQDEAEMLAYVKG